MKRKKLFALFCAVLMLSSLITVYFVRANDTDWHYDSSTKTLYITGSGAMDDYENTYSQPWNQYINVIENVVLENGVTTVGNYAFVGARQLRSVTLPDSVSTIGENAFASCPNLAELSLSQYVTSIADTTFAADGLQAKEDFELLAPYNSYAANFALMKSVPLGNPVECGTNRIYVNKGKMVVLPYEAKVNGTFCFYTTSNHDTYGYVYNEAFSNIAEGDDNNGDTDFLINVNLEKGKKYYFVYKIYNPTLSGTVEYSLNATQFTASGTMYAMASPDGTPSDIVLDDALLDGTQTDGTYDFTVSGAAKEVEVSCDSRTFRYTVTPDKENIVLNMCDVNDDGIVNGRDYVKMKNESSKYKSLFGNFAGYNA